MISINELDRVVALKMDEIVQMINLAFAVSNRYTNCMMPLCRKNELLAVVDTRLSTTDEVNKTSQDDSPQKYCPTWYLVVVDMMQIESSFEYHDENSSSVADCEEVDA